MTKLITQLTELREKATPTPWKGDDYGYIWGPNMEMIADQDDEEAYIVRMRGTGENLPQKANRDLIIEAVNAFPELKRQSDAMERFVEAVRGLGNGINYGDAWELQRDATLAEYEEAIK